MVGINGHRAENKLVQCSINRQNSLRLPWKQWFLNLLKMKQKERKKSAEEISRRSIGISFKADGDFINLLRQYVVDQREPRIYCSHLSDWEFIKRMFCCLRRQWISFFVEIFHKISHPTFMQLPGKIFRDLPHHLNLTPGGSCSRKLSIQFTTNLIKFTTCEFFGSIKNFSHFFVNDQNKQLVLGRMSRKAVNYKQ